MTTHREIAADDIVAHPGSFGEADGRVFRWNGRLLRGLRGASEVALRDLAQKGVLTRLIDDGLVVDTAITEFTTTEYALVLEHRELWPVSVAAEWCPEMLRDAARVVLHVQSALYACGYRLHDAHPWNVVFDGTTPRFVDVGSFESSADGRGWPAAEEFSRFFLNPLRLYALGHEHIARELLRDHNTGVTDREAQLLDPSVATFARRLGRSWLRRAAGRLPSPVVSLLQRSRRAQELADERLDLNECRHEVLLGKVNALSFPAISTPWSGYYDEEFPDFERRSGWTPKHESVDRVLSRLKPLTVVDVASNRGWYAQLAARHGCSVVAFDVDQPSVSAMYGDAQREGLRITPLIMDLTRPTPGEGPLNEHLPPATQRLQGDLALGLALLHHLCYWQRLPLILAVESIISFTSDAAVIEFIDPADQYVAEWARPTPDGYDLELLRAHLGNRFNRVSEMPSNLPTRLLFVCEGKRL